MSKKDIKTATDETTEFLSFLETYETIRENNPELLQHTVEQDPQELVDPDGVKYLASVGFYLRDNGTWDMRCDWHHIEQMGSIMGEMLDRLAKGELADEIYDSFEAQCVNLDPKFVAEVHEKLKSRKSRSTEKGIIRPLNALKDLDRG